MFKQKTVFPDGAGILVETAHKRETNGDNAKRIIISSILD